MKKLVTVGEYCKINGVTVQSVYARINRGTLEHEIVKGVKMVLTDSATALTMDSKATMNEEVNSYTTLLQSTIKSQKKEIKRLHKTIKQLEKQNIKSMDTLIKLFSGDIKHIMPVNKSSDEFIEAKLSKKKKKSNKKKK